MTAPTAPGGSPDSIAPKHTPENRGKTQQTTDNMRAAIVEHVASVLEIARSCSLEGVPAFGTPEQLDSHLQQMSDEQVWQIYRMINRTESPERTGWALPD